MAISTSVAVAKIPKRTITRLMVACTSECATRSPT